MNIDNEISKDDLFRKIDDLKIKLYDTNDALKSAENRIKELNKCNDYANEELDQHKNNWEELKEHLEAMIRIYENEYKSVDDAEHYRSILNKMKELEEDK